MTPKPINGVTQCGATAHDVSHVQAVASPGELTDAAFANTGAILFKIKAPAIVSAGAATADVKDDVIYALIRGGMLTL